MPTTSATAATSRAFRRPSRYLHSPSQPRLPSPSPPPLERSPASLSRLQRRSIPTPSERPHPTPTISTTPPPTPRSSTSTTDPHCWAQAHCTTAWLHTRPPHYPPAPTPSALST